MWRPSGFVRRFSGSEELAAGLGSCEKSSFLADFFVGSTILWRAMHEWREASIFFSRALFYCPARHRLAVICSSGEKGWENCHFSIKRDF